MILPQWTLEDNEVILASAKGFSYEVFNGRFFMKRSKDEARIWPHIDGFISCFLRQGSYVKHKKFIDFNRAIDRRFGD